MNFYVDALKRYAEFSGRATRQQFWMFVLINFVISLVLQAIDYFAKLNVNGVGILGFIYALALFVPTLAIGARRLHDIGKSGWWQLLGGPWTCCIGLIVLIVWFATDSEPGSNKYGPNPKGGSGRKVYDDE